MALQGKMKQMKRMAVYLHFSKSQSALLFATDIASRGLDITSVDWVLQVFVLKTFFPKRLIF